MTNGEELENAVDYALAAGYRHFDTAEAYENEELLGAAFQKLLPKHNLKREDIWITTKVAVWKMDYENSKESV